ncbi:MAG TPA: response regulator, partial [Myxococcota bacterium]|nr:response regulator [Myxococcota bacterium]
MIGSPRVLIADDESQLLRVLVRAFEKHGYSVVAATDGKLAIDLLRRADAAIDAIVLDAAIGPGGAGGVLEVVAAERPALAVVVTSGDQLPSPLRCQLRAQ